MQELLDEHWKQIELAMRLNHSFTFDHKQQQLLYDQTGETLEQVRAGRI